MVLLVLVDHSNCYETIARDQQLRISGVELVTIISFIIKIKAIGGGGQGQKIHVDLIRKISMRGN